MTKFTYVASYWALYMNDRNIEEKVKVYSVIMAHNKEKAEKLADKMIEKLEDVPNITSIYGFLGVRGVKELTIEDVVDPAILNRYY